MAVPVLSEITRWCLVACGATTLPDKSPSREYNIWSSDMAKHMTENGFIGETYDQVMNAIIVPSRPKHGGLSQANHMLYH